MHTERICCPKVVCVVQSNRTLQLPLGPRSCHEPCHCSLRCCQTHDVDKPSTSSFAVPAGLYCVTLPIGASNPTALLCPFQEAAAPLPPTAAPPNRQAQSNTPASFTQYLLDP